MAVHSLAQALTPASTSTAPKGQGAQKTSDTGDTEFGDVFSLAETDTPKNSVEAEQISQTPRSDLETASEDAEEIVTEAIHAVQDEADVEDSFPILLARGAKKDPVEPAPDHGAKLEIKAAPQHGRTGEKVPEAAQQTSARSEHVRADVEPEVGSRIKPSQEPEKTVTPRLNETSALKSQPAPQLQPNETPADDGRAPSPLPATMAKDTAAHVETNAGIVSGTVAKPLGLNPSTAAIEADTPIEAKVEAASQTPTRDAAHPTLVQSAPLARPLNAKASPAPAAQVDQAEIDTTFVSPRAERLTRLEVEHVQPAASPPPAPPPSPQAMVAPPMVQTTDQQTKDVRHSDDGDWLGETKLESSAQNARLTASSAINAMGQQRVDIPRHIAMQIQDAIRNAPDRAVELTLQPEELGRVRLSISASEAGVTLNVLAERQETLDLMRRHSEALARELSDMGFESIDLAFGQGTESDTETDDKDGSATSTFLSLDEDLKQDGTTTPPGTLGLDPTRALDMRV